jgi:hypothetical protein
MAVRGETNVGAADPIVGGAVEIAFGGVVGPRSGGAEGASVGSNGILVGDNVVVAGTACVAPEQLASRSITLARANSRRDDRYQSIASSF